LLFGPNPVAPAAYMRPQVDSQRLLLWATKQGKAEELMSELNVRHFERRESVNVRANLLAAAAAAGLDPEATAAFLDTDELKEEVRCRNDQLVPLIWMRPCGEGDTTPIALWSDEGDAGVGEL
jgi:2-hydroxychromene-2-carboxylate isomerase